MKSIQDSRLMRAQLVPDSSSDAESVGDCFFFFVCSFLPFAFLPSRPPFLARLVSSLGLLNLAPVPPYVLYVSIGFHLVA